LIAKVKEDSITKDRSSGRKATKESKKVEEKKEQKKIIEDTDHQSQFVSPQSKSTPQRQKFVLTKRLDRQKSMSPTRQIPTL